MKKLLAVLAIGAVLISLGYLNKNDQASAQEAKSEFKVAEISPGA